MAEVQVLPPEGSDSGLPSNVAAGFCAIFILVGGIVFYVIEKKDLYVRHWAVQTIFFGGALVAVSLFVGIFSALFGHLPIIGILFLLLAGLLNFAVLCVGFVLWVIGIVKAFRGERWEYPFISALGKKYFPNLA